MPTDHFNENMKKPHFRAQGTYIFILYILFEYITNNIMYLILVHYDFI